MIQPQTYLTVADNTGAKKIMCIRVLGASRRYAKIGDIIVAVVKEATPNMSTKRSDIVKAVVTVSYTHLRAHETRHDLVCRLLLEKKKKI